MDFNEVNFRKKVLRKIKFDEDYFSVMIDESPLVYLIYIYYLIKNNKTEKAISLFKKIEPNDDLKSYYILIEALLEDIKEVKIEKLYNSLDLKKDNIWTLIELYYILKDTDDLYKAFGYLDKSIEIEPDFYEARYEKILNLSSVDNCDIIIQEILSFPETYIDENILNTLAFAFFNCYNIENAEKILNRSLKIKETKEAFFLLGIISFDKYNDKQKALSCYEKSLELDENQLEVLTEKAWLLFEINREIEAEKIFLKLLDINQNNETFNQVIHFYFTINEYRKAYDFIKKSKEILGSNYLNDGYEILYYTLIKNNYLSQRFALEFKNKYSTFEIDWLKGLILEFTS